MPFNEKNPFYAGWRWSDNQRVWWRLLWSRDANRNAIAAVVEVHGGDYYIETRNGDVTVSSQRTTYRPFLRLSIPLVATVMLALPRFLLRGCGGKEYGFRYDLREGFVSVFYGRRSWDSDKEQAWHCHVPWQAKRMVRYRFFALDGVTLFKELYNAAGRTSWRELAAIKDSPALPRCSYKLTDYDGETIYCTAFVEEMLWKHGEKWCRWLSWFVPDRVRKYVDLEFCPGYGKKKHDWKGGTCGHSTDLKPGESVDAAVRRYCGEHDLTYVERLPTVYVPPSPPEKIAEPQAVTAAINKEAK